MIAKYSTIVITVLFSASFGFSGPEESVITTKNIILDWARDSYDRLAQENEEERAKELAHFLSNAKNLLTEHFASDITCQAQECSSRINNVYKYALSGIVSHNVHLFEVIRGYKERGDTIDQFLARLLMDRLEPNEYDRLGNCLYTLKSRETHQKMETGAFLDEGFTCIITSMATENLNKFLKHYDQRLEGDPTSSINSTKTE